MRYGFTLSYDGTEYAGWQRQKNARTVQETLEDAFFSALGVRVSVTASGRTDAGVHALGQVCHVDMESTVPPEKLPDCINRFLPSDVKILSGFEGKNGFDANRTAKRKTYRYDLYVSAREIPLSERYAVRVDDAPTLSELIKTAKLMEGEHDFKAFCASGSSVKTTVRTVYSIRVAEELVFGVRKISFFVCGNGFLYNMVRTLVGEILAIASGKKSEESLQQAFLTGERTLVAKTMPAKGLTLQSVEYENEV